VLFKEGTASALPFATASLDAVIIRLSFHHFLESQKVLMEMHCGMKLAGPLVIADVVSAEDPQKAALHNAIEKLRDPSHVRMLTACELIALMTRPGISIERQDAWDRAREFEERVGVVANPERIASLRTVVHALAKAGQDAGIGLAMRDGAVHFFHRWLLNVVRRTERCGPSWRGTRSRIAQ
jgi:SAM-dependent methyltransferase